MRSTHAPRWPIDLHCAPGETAKLAADVVLRALGNVHSRGGTSWSTDESKWELARRKLLQLASCR